MIALYNGMGGGSAAAISAVELLGGGEHSFVFMVLAVLGRVGFGRPLPFGPFLALGGLAWIFGGWRIWEMYFNFVAGI